MNSNVSGLDAVGEKKTISIVGYKQWLEILERSVSAEVFPIAKPDWLKTTTLYNTT